MSRRDALLVLRRLAEHVAMGDHQKSQHSETRALRTLLTYRRRFFEIETPFGVSKTWLYNLDNVMGS